MLGLRTSKLRLANRFDFATGATGQLRYSRAFKIHLVRVLSEGAAASSQNMSTSVVDEDKNAFQIVNEAKYVVLKGSGGAGLGDRICGLAAAILYARWSNRVLFIDWRDRAFGSQTSNLFPFLLRVRGVPCVDRLPETQSVLPAVWRGRLDMELDELRAWDLKERGITWSGDAPRWDRNEAIERYSVDSANLAWPEDVVVLWSGASISPLSETLKRLGKIERDVTPNELLGKVVSECLEFNDEIEQRIEDFWAQRVGGRSVLGVHYRKTDEAAAARSLPTENQYLDATDRALRNLPKDAAIFLATDNVDVQTAFRARYSDREVVWTEKWLPESGGSIHKNSDCPDGFRAAQDALLDVGLLARCDRLVLTGNSSFSSLAEWFSRRSSDTRELVFPKTGSLPRRVVRTLRRLADHYSLRGS